MEQLTEYQFTSQRTRHDWKTILNGTIWRLTKGVDFQCEALSFYNAATTYAKRHGITAKVVVDGNSVVIQDTPTQN